MYKWDHMAFVYISNFYTLQLYLTIIIYNYILIPSRSIHVVANSKILFFYGCTIVYCIYSIPRFLKEMGIPDNLTCLLRSLYADQEAIVRTGYGTPDWFQMGKGVCQSCILSPCLFKLYAEYIMQNAGLDETQAGIKIAKRNINNLR